MADSRWVSTSGDLNAAASYAPSGVPADTGSLYFDGSSNQSVVSGLTAFSGYANGITRLWTQSPYLGDVGANGNSLVAAIKYLIHNGSGSFYHSHLSAWPKSYIVVNSPNQHDAFILSGTDGAGGVDLTVAVLQGHAEVLTDNTIVLGTLLVGGAGVQYPSVEIGVINACNSYRQTSGFVTTKTGLGTSTDRALIDGGTLIYDSTATSGWANVEVAGGLFEYNGTGTMAFCIVSSGTLDMNQDSRAKTITKLILMPGANFLTHDNITVPSGGFFDYRVSPPILGGSLP